MWNLSYRWQRRTRLAAGVAVLVASVAAAIGLSRSAVAQRAWSGVRELAAEIRAAHQQRVEVIVPADLAARPGTLVYDDRPDGIAQVVGRVVDVHSEDPTRARLSIRLMGKLADGAASGGVLRGASATLDLRAAMRLLVSPNTPGDEALRARDTIWPSVTKHVLPAMTDEMIREISQELSALDEQDSALFARSFRQLHQELRPLEDELVDRLARRAWDTIGVKGLAAGVWHSTAENVQNQGAEIVRWWWELFGDQPAAPASSRPFLSEEMSLALQDALKDEAAAFWREHRTAIVAAVTRVVAERRPDFEAAFSQRWADRLFQRAVVPAWRAGERQVLEAVQVYANDFAARRLFTSSGGPRLLFAYALRSSLAISDDPLLIFSPGPAGAPGRITYEPLVR
jgi:hypothetical protein